jgi:hypothetical protein
MNERTDYTITVHLPNCRILIAEDLTFAQAYVEMVKLGKGYKQLGMNPIEANIDYMTFSTPTGEMVGIWAHPDGDITATVIERQRQRYLARIVDVDGMVAGIEDGNDYTVDVDRTPTDGIFDSRDGSDVAEESAGV